MKKWFSVLTAGMLAAAVLPAERVETIKAENTLSVVTTIFPVYDWTKQIIADEEGIDLTLLVDNGVDLHNYQPTVSDMIKISDCDIFIYVGGESDAWVKDALAQTRNEEIIVVNLMDALGDAVFEEEIVEGMQAEEGEEPEEESESSAGAGDEKEMDEHVWLSLKNAAVLCESIAEALCEADPANEETWRGNLQDYLESLSALDDEYRAALEEAPVNTILFGDRFPFRYLAEDYGLDYYAAFAGCAAETEASFETIAFLAKKTDELELPAVLTTEGNNHRIAETIVSCTKTGDQKILALDSMQSVDRERIEEGASYLGIMESNLQVLKEALNGENRDQDR